MLWPVETPSIESTASDAPAALAKPATEEKSIVAKDSAGTATGMVKGLEPVAL